MMRSLVAVLLAIIMMLAIAPASQTQEKSPPDQKVECATVLPPGQLKVEQAREAIAAPDVDPPTDVPYYLPLTIHIVRQSNGAGGFTLGELEIAMRDLNRMWQPVGIQFFIYGGIDIINDDTHFNVPNLQSSRDALRQVNVVANTINVYFTNLANLCGQSTFTSDAIQGVLMDISCAGNAAAPATFAHEIGHYLDLFHTHEMAFGAECPRGNNCSTAGDRLCDTSADPGLIDFTMIPPRSRVNTNCVYDNSAAIPGNCDQTAYNPPTKNLMSYSTQTCRDQFTANQISKALQTLRSANNRKSLITSGARYVDPLASASNSSCTYSSPCRRLSKAVQVASPGDFIFLKPGAHQELFLSDKPVSLNRWGTSGVVDIAP